MSERTPEQKGEVLLARATPAAHRFIEYLTGEFAVKARAMAIGHGLTDREAAYVVNTCMAAAAKAGAQAVSQCVRDRAFTRIGE